MLPVMIRCRLKKAGTLSSLSERTTMSLAGLVRIAAFLSLAASPEKTLAATRRRRAEGISFMAIPRLRHRFNRDESPHGCAFGVRRFIAAFVVATACAMV